MKWYTISEFEEEKPVCMYHKEQEEMNLENNGIKNLHVLARADFEVKGGQKYVLRISADDYYKLYINGKYVTQGPAPAYPEYYYYNEIDVSDYLVDGENIFAVHLYYQGLINRVWNSGDNRFGIATELLCHSPEGTSMEEVRELKWRYHISNAYEGETIGYETQFLENFDSRKWDENWLHLDCKDADYKPMIEAKWADYKLVKQPTKQLMVYQKTLKMLSENIDENQGSRRITRLFDVGEEVTGTLHMRVKGEAGAKVVIRYGEECEIRDGGQQVRFDMRCNCKYEEVWTLADGTNALEQFDYKAFRYVELLCEETVEIEEIWVNVRHYPMEEKTCTFTCSKKELEDIFLICKNGVKYGTQEAYLDCPTREKGQYLGDSIVTAHAQVWLTGSTEMLRKCIDQFAKTSAVCKGLMAVAPGAYMQEIADFSLLWSQLLLLDYKFTGEKAFLETYYPVAKGIVEHFRQYERNDGLLRQVAGKWNLVDWPENLRDEYDFTLSRPIVADGCHNVVNALYVGAMKTLAEIEQILEIPISYEWEAYKNAYFKVFYDKNTGLFVDSEESRHSAVHSNVYPLYFGLVEEKEALPIVKFLEEKGLCCGVFVSYFFLKGLAKAGYRDVMYRLLVNESEHGWINMLREGATTCFEAWGKEQKWNTSLCHPWASAPIPLLIEEIAGFKLACDKESVEYVWEPYIPEELETFSLQIPYRGKRYLIQKIKGEETQCKLLGVLSTSQW